MSDVMKKERGQFGRWLRGGLLSGRPKQTVSGITDIIFFLAFTFCFSWEFINTTMFKKLFSDDFELRMEGWYNIAVIAAFACGVAALLLQDSVRQALFEALILTAGYLHWKVGGGKYSFFVFCVLIVGMTGRSFKALLVIACSIGTAMTAAAFAASQLGVIEDLVSTGKSSLIAVKALREKGCVVKGMAAIFTYGLQVAADNFAEQNVDLITLTDYDTLISVAQDRDYVRPEDLESLAKWRVNPERWSDERMNG